MIRRIGLVAVVASGVMLTAWINGCGGDDAVDTDASADGSNTNDGTSNDGNTSDGPIILTDGGTCALNGQQCKNASECCSLNCTGLGVCGSPINNCKQANDTCTKGTDCCSLSCVGGKCATKCTSDNQPCTQNSECCGQSCVGVDGGKTCAPLNGSCKTSGNKCTTGGECCSKVCSGGVCLQQVSFCGQTGDICTNNVDCCGNSCVKQPNASVGICGVPPAPGGTQCDIAGTVCSTFDGGIGDGGIPACGGNCCSRACAPGLVPNVSVCQPPSGCKPTGEICGKDDDCCGSLNNKGGGNGSVTCSKGTPDASAGRCDNGTACRPAGAICKLATSSCNAENNCCAGNVNQNPLVCQQDLLGIPRCTGVGQCQDAGVAPDGGSLVNKACSSSADCCGLPCVPNPNGPPPFICGAGCVQQGQKCTTSGDCCKGLPCTNGLCGFPVPDGGTTDGGTSTDGGTTTDAGCALYGQQCTVSGDCCNGVPCTGGRCVVPPPN